MKNFICRFALFITVCLFVPCTVIFLLPATPRAKSSLLFAKLDKDSLLANTPSPRIIFVGGSNLSFGINSRLLKEKFRLNPVNTGVDAAIGLIYMMDNTAKHIRPGDIVVVVPEYSQYYGKHAYGREQLLRTLVDVSPASELKQLRLEQLASISPYLLKYIFSKLKPREYSDSVPDPIYSRSSFNEFGDVYTHWNMAPVAVKPLQQPTGKLNMDVFRELDAFRDLVKRKGAEMYVSFPGFQSSSFKNLRKHIKVVEQILHKRKFRILGSASRYVVQDSLIFNTAYHLRKKAVDQRTSLLIQDLVNVPGFAEKYRNQPEEHTRALSGVNEPGADLPLN